MVEDTIRVLHQSDPNDTRFQFEVIKQLAESVKVNSDALRGISDTQTKMLERLARIEEQKVHEAVASVEGRVMVLELADARREGGAGMLKTIKDWAPFLAMLFSAACVLWLYGRSAGFVPAPPAAHDEQKTVPSK